MADYNFGQSQTLQQTQRQSISQAHLQCLNMIHMTTADLIDDINKTVEENPFLEKKDPIVDENYSYDSGAGQVISDENQQALENYNDSSLTIQEQLNRELGLVNTTEDEKKLCLALIENLDSDGFYGSSINPIKLLKKNQSKELLDKCIDIIQHLTPIGTCCKNFEESLYIQAKIDGTASPLTLFILNGNYKILLSTRGDKRVTPNILLKRIKKIKEEWDKKEFHTTEFPLTKDDINIEAVEEVFEYLDSNILNLHPASEYNHNRIDNTFLDIVAEVKKIPGSISKDDIEKGEITGDETCHFQVLDKSGNIPEVIISQEMEANLDKFTSKESKELYRKALTYIDNLKYRKGTILLQVCAIVQLQKAYFIKGKRGLIPLTRKEVADIVGVHESTVSRLTSKKNPKGLTTPFGVIKLCDFFTSGIKYVNKKNVEKMVGREAVKERIEKHIKKAMDENKVLSDNALTKILNDEGIEIARRTVAKYRAQLHIENSYNREK